MTLSDVLQKTRPMTIEELARFRMDILYSYLQRVEKLEGNCGFLAKNREFKTYNFWFFLYLKMMRFWIKLPKLAKFLTIWIPCFCHLRLSQSSEKLYLLLNDYTPGAYEILMHTDTIYHEKLKELFSC